MQTDHLLHTPLLHELKLYTCTCTIPQGSAVPLFKSLSSLNSFTTLEIEQDDMNYYKLCPEDCQALCMLLSTSQSLTKLKVTGTLQPDSISKYLNDGLNKSICLEHLDIRLKELYMNHNPIGDDGAMALAKILKVNQSLTVLDITRCSITEVGVSHLADALCFNSSLDTIVLDQNSVKDQGAIALAQMLNRNKSLKELHLQSCSITQYGISHLTDALETNHSIIIMTLWGNSADGSFVPN